MLKARPWLLVAPLLLASCEWKHTHHRRLAISERLTEDIAVGCTRKALEDAGYPSEAIEPVCYRQPCRPDEPYFARNTVNPDGGYVLWHLKADTRRRSQFSVAVERRGDQLSCTASWVK